MPAGAPHAGSAQFGRTWAAGNRRRGCCGGSRHSSGCGTAVSVTAKRAPRRAASARRRAISADWPPRRRNAGLVAPTPSQAASSSTNSAPAPAGSSSGESQRNSAGALSASPKPAATVAVRTGRARRRQLVDRKIGLDARRIVASRARIPRRAGGASSARACASSRPAFDEGTESGQIICAARRRGSAESAAW